MTTTMHAVPRRARSEEALTPSQTALVAERFQAVMEALGLDLEDPNLSGTSLRVARACAELFSGLDPGERTAIRGVFTDDRRQQQFLGQLRRSQS